MTKIYLSRNVEDISLSGLQNNDYLRYDTATENWIPTSSGLGNATEPDIMTIGTRAGELSVESNPLRIYNCYTYNRIINKVFLSAGTPPAGDSIIVNVLVDGSGICTVPNRPSIAISGYTGESTTIANPNWDTGSYITWDITQIGDVTPGSDLVVHIISEKA